MSQASQLQRLHRIDLNLFRVFDVVYRERNLSRAAAVLYLSQSAVSHALARLREQIGDPLFTRQGRGVAPTPLARQLAPAIRDALSSLQGALQHQRSFEPERDVERVVLAVHDELEPILLPPLLRRLRRVAPRLTVASVRLDRANLKGDLAAGRLDVAIDVAQPTEPELQHAALLHAEFCVAAASNRRRLTAKEYLAAEHVSVSSRRTGLPIEDFLLSRQGLQRQVVLRCQHYQTAGRIVASSGLLLTLPRPHAELLRSTFPLRLFKPPLALPPMEVHLYWHRQADAEPASRWLREELRGFVQTVSSKQRTRRAEESVKD
jgi:DNA-binding transcriptional LysR family regulator